MKNMYLYVEFIDTQSAYNTAMLGFTTTQYRRIKRIKLTEEQVKELEPRVINGFKEDLSVLCIQKEE